jgi:hypothetical protein
VRARLTRCLALLQDLIGIGSGIGSGQYAFECEPG